jgi:hypothetical protein
VFGGTLGLDIATKPTFRTHDKALLDLLGAKAHDTIDPIDCRTADEAWGSQAGPGSQIVTDWLTAQARTSDQGTNRRADRTADNQRTGDVAGALRMEA